MAVGAPAGWPRNTFDLTDFARQMLMRLPRKMDGVKFAQRVLTDQGRERVAIDASGSNGFRATLLVDRGTCVPIALEYTTTRAFVGGVAHIDLLQYRPFGGVRFPTVLRTTIGGQLQEEERVTSIEVNTPAAAKAFPGRR